MDNNISVLRIYFRYGQKAQNQSFWQKLWNNNLGQQLLKKSKEMNIEQANIFTAKAGYLDNDKISYNISEIPPSKNPVCLELIDNENKINQFLKLNKDHLKQAKIVIVNPNSEILFT